MGARRSGTGRSPAEGATLGMLQHPGGREGGAERHTLHQVHAPSSAEKWIPTCKLCIAIKKNISWILSSSFIPSFRHGFFIA